MPLVVLCGRPSSGKTTFALKLKEYLENRFNNNNNNNNMRIELINHNTIALPTIIKQDGYNTTTNEKMIRGAFKTAVNHLLTQNVTVILDSLNYIKGFRYELFCIARGESTSHCCIYIDTPIEITTEWNYNNTIENKLSDELFQDLNRRFEEPKEKNRWEKPLFHITNIHELLNENISNIDINNQNNSEIKDNNNNDDDKEIKNDDKKEEINNNNYKNNDNIDENISEDKNNDNDIDNDDDETPLNQLFNSIYQVITGHKLKQKFSTTIKRTGSANLLNQVDSITQRIVKHILQYQRTHSGGGTITFPNSTHELTIYRKISMAELQRYRRFYVNLFATHPPNNLDDIADGFIEHLIKNIQ